MKVIDTIIGLIFIVLGVGCLLSAYIGEGDTLIKIFAGLMFCLSAIGIMKCSDQ